MQRLIMRDITLCPVNGEALGAYRRQAGLSQRQLAMTMERLGAAELNTQQAVSRSETSFETAVTPNTAACLIKALKGGF